MMDKAEVLKRKITHGLYLSLPKDVADDVLEKMVEYAQQVINEGKYCIHCGEIMTWNKHKIWCNVFKNQQ